MNSLDCKWKEKSLTIVAGPYTEYKAGDVVEIISNNGRRWVSRVVEGMEALGTWLDSRGCSGPAVEKHGQPRLQTLAMRRVRIAAWQMVRCPDDANCRMYWEESVTWRCDEE